MFKNIFDQKKKQLIPYLTAGVPSLEETEKLVDMMVQEGVEILELGVPFSDPSADGAILQLASSEALKNNVQLKDVLNLAERLHQKHPRLAIVLFTYLNPLLAMGLENYVLEAKSKGVAATLTVDLPIEEAEEYIELHQKFGLQTVFLSSPTTSMSRLKNIQAASSAFLYYISRTGVTGEQKEISESLGFEVAKLKEVAKGPLAIGFGISNAEQAAKISQFCDAVIIGSAYMRLILEQKDSALRFISVQKLTRDCVKSINRG
ncbi:MAG: tryptophan synthase subunit alpha [Bacteriovoracaceae bacterium]